jgi:hypothetical protein
MTPYADGRSLHRLRGNNRRLHLVEDVDHLLEARRFRINHIVGKNHGKRLVADQVAGHQHSVSQAHCFFLSDVCNAAEIGNVACHGEQVVFAARFQLAFQFHADIKMIFDNGLAATGDNDDLIATRGNGFLDAILNDRLVDDRKHFLGDGFGCGQETRTQPGCREDGFADSGSGHLQTGLSNRTWFQRRWQSATAQCSRVSTRASMSTVTRMTTMGWQLASHCCIAQKSCGC